MTPYSVTALLHLDEGLANVLANFVQMVFSDWNKSVTVEKPPGV
jgi:hypothetical protein